MIVRLHNLSARVPAMTDLRAIAELRDLCDDAAPGDVDASEHALRLEWQAPSFALKTDAWVIVTNLGRIVGYAAVRCKGDRLWNEFTLHLHVHPDYRERGLATLLIWLVEERARQLMQNVSTEIDVVLSSSVSSLNQWAREVYTREGYTLTRRFWRLVIAVEEAVTRSHRALSRQGQLTVDVVLDADAEMDGDQGQPPLYIARQYGVYTKVLRAGRSCNAETVLVTQRGGV